MNEDFYAEFYGGLTALVESSFPKHCDSCDRLFETAEQFLLETGAKPGSMTGLEAADTKKGFSIVKAYRTCPCGAVLADAFSDRRDMSAKGVNRRNRFSSLVGFLEEKGIEPEIARWELLKVMRGEPSELLGKIKPPT